MRDFLKKYPEQAVRVVVVFVAFGLLVLLIRQFIIPRELKDTVLQKITATEREAARGIVYAGAQICTDCHADINVAKKSGYHRDLACESCHSAAQKHVENPTEVKPLSPRKRDYCSFCHTYNSTRPTGFPQINPVTHNPLKPCITCHNAHNPKPPRTPTSCGACHANIERTKVASQHALLACSVCHKAPEKHKTAPRSFIPTKPETREFCGTCHGKETKKEGVPTIDMAVHGEKYVCWQCHNQHM